MILEAQGHTVYLDTCGSDNRMTKVKKKKKAKMDEQFNPMTASMRLRAEIHVSSKDLDEVGKVSKRKKSKCCARR